MPIIDRNLLDFTVGKTGTLAALFDVAVLNGISITENLMPGLEISLPAKKYQIEMVAQVVRAIQPENIMLKERQTVVDFTCQHAGTVEALFDVAVLNGISITANVLPGSVLKATPVDERTVAFYKNSTYDIVTDKTKTPLPGGIGYMQIGTSFKVS